MLAQGASAVLLMSLLVSLVGSSVLHVLPATAQSGVMAIVLMLLPAVVLVRYSAYAMRGLGAITTGQIMEQILIPGLVLVGILAIYLSGTAMLAVAAAQVQLVVALIGCGVGLGLLIRKVGLIKPVRTGVLQVIAAAIPFGLLAGINVLNGQIDILMLGYFAHADQVGMYRIAVLGAALVGFGLQAANVVLPTLFARLQARNDQAQLQALVTLSAQLILACALPVALVFWLWGAQLVSWVFGVAYVDAYLPLAILALGELVGASLGSMGFLLYMSGEERRALTVLMATALLNVLLNLILIPLYGLAGAAIATACGQAVRLVLLYWLVVRHLGLSPLPFRRIKL